MRTQAWYGVGLAGGTTVVAAVVALVVAAQGGGADASAADPTTAASADSTAPAAPGGLTPTLSAARPTVAHSAPKAAATSVRPPATSHPNTRPAAIRTSPDGAPSVAGPPPANNPAPNLKPSSKPASNSAPKPAPKPQPAPTLHVVSVPPAPKPVVVASPGISSIANAVLAMLNQERAQNGLRALSMSSQLISSAHAHNLAMYRTNTFAHQVSGEAGLGARISATGLGWTAAGENIATSSVTSTSSAQSLEAMMYNEKPPDDGHRQNILSTKFTMIGIDVISTGGGKMWITEDFAN